MSHFGQLYGRSEITYNVHQLTHLAAEYHHYGPLDNIAAFPYENYLAQLKHLLRKPHLPLQQIVKRLSERDPQTSQINKGLKFMHLHHDGPLVSHIGHGEQYRKVVTTHFTLCRSGDNCIQIVDDIALVDNIVKEAQETYVIFRKFTRKESYVQYPFESANIDCYKVWDLSSCVGVVKLQIIKTKYILFPDKKALIAIPLIHTK